MINQKSSRVEQIIQVLDRLPKLPQPDGDLAVVELLTPSEITQVMRYLNQKRHNPGLVAHIWRAKEPFPDDWKFDLRQALLGLAVAIASAQAQDQGGDKPRKLHKL